MSSVKTSQTQDDSLIPEVTVKSKKEDILNAYQELLKQMQDNAENSETRKTALVRKQQDITVEKASSLSPEAIVKSISNLEGEIRKWFGELGEKLIKELQKLIEAQDALSIEKQRLEEIHAIKVEADTLAQLIQAHKEKKIALEEEQKIFDDEIKKQTDMKKEAWKREQEEYHYETQMKRRKEEAEYEEKKTIKEKELKEREIRLIEQQKELEELRKLKELFDERIEEEVEEASAKATEITKKEEEVKARILCEKVGAEKRIAELTIESLKQRLSGLEQEISSLKSQLEKANSGVKDIALRVIEGNAARVNEQHRYLKAYEAEKPMRDEKVMRE